LVKQKVQKKLVSFIVFV